MYSECLLDCHYICKCVCVCVRMCNAETKTGYKNDWKLDNGSVKETHGSIVCSVIQQAWITHRQVRKRPLSHNQSPTWKPVVST